MFLLGNSARFRSEQALSKGIRRQLHQGNYSSVSNRRGRQKNGGVYIRQLLIERGANGRGCWCWLVFNKKRMLIEGGMHVGSFSIEKEC